MALRICFHDTKLLLRHRREVRAIRWVQVPKELPRRPPFVSFTGIALLSVPAYFMFNSAYIEMTWTTRRNQLLCEVSRSIEPIIDLPVDLNQVYQNNFRHVRIRGHFEHENEVLIKNKYRYLGIEALRGTWFQYMLTNNVSQNDDRLFKPDPGHLVVTPFVLSDGKTRILVNRGWIPPEKADPATRPDAQVKGQVELTGYIRTQDEANVNPFLYLIQDPDKREFRYRDIKGMARALKTLPIYVDVDRDSAPHYGTAPLGGQTNTENFEHPAFAIYTNVLCGMSVFLLWYAKYIGPIRLHRYT